MTLAELERAYAGAVDQLRDTGYIPPDWRWRRARRRGANVTVEYSLPGGGYIQFLTRYYTPGPSMPPRRLLGWRFSVLAPRRWHI